jgi:REP element-mobilizing transposase RayT
MDFGKLSTISNNPMNFPENKIYYERNLPHYQEPGATLFITFRLAGSLPHEVQMRLNDELLHRKELLEKNKSADGIKALREQYQKEIFVRWDKELDLSQRGPVWLQVVPVAELVWEALHYRDGKEYTLNACCIMPNHVHLVCTPLTNNDEPRFISTIMHSLKGYTARNANLILGRTGGFWQHESYDHLVRNPEDYCRIVEYVVNNPVKAGLPAKWIYARGLK